VEQTIRRIMDFLKSSAVVKSMFLKHDVPISYLDKVSIKFDKLDVSAQTRDCVIFINSDFLDELKFSEHIHYIVHELCHVLQQMTSDVKLKPNVDYLDMPTEMEAFKCQVAFMKEFYDDDTAKDYVEELLDFHQYEDKEKESKRKSLMGE
jgi:hypothetical protein